MVAAELNAKLTAKHNSKMKTVKLPKVISTDPMDMTLKKSPLPRQPSRDPTPIRIDEPIVSALINRSPVLQRDDHQDVEESLAASKITINCPFPLSTTPTTQHTSESQLADAPIVLKHRI